MLRVSNPNLIVPGLGVRDITGRLTSVVRKQGPDIWQGKDLKAAWYPFQPVAKVNSPGYQAMLHGRTRHLTRFNGPIPEFQTRWIDDILALPNRIEGLDIERVHAYIDQFEYERCDYRVVSKTLDVEAIKRAFEVDDLSDLNNSGLGEYDGFYYAGLEKPVCLVFRDDALETLLGPKFTEGNLVHELAHAGGKRFSYFGKNKDLGQRMRFGYVLADKVDNFQLGTVLEEGFCEWHRMNYLNKAIYPDDEVRERLAERMGMGDFEAYLFARFQREIDDKGQHVVGSYWYAFEIFRTLTHLDPEFFERANRARFSARRLGEFFNAIAKIEPGLYIKLRDLPFEREALKHMYDYLCALRKMRLGY